MQFTRPKITSNSLLKACTTVITVKQTHTSAVQFRSALYIFPGSKLPAISTYYSTNFYGNKEFLCITHTVEHNYISPSSTVGIQLHVSALYVGHLQVVI